MRRGRVTPIKIILRRFNTTMSKTTTHLVLTRRNGRTAQGILRRLFRNRPITQTNKTLSFRIVTRGNMRPRRQLSSRMISQRPSQPTPIKIATRWPHNELHQFMIRPILLTLRRRRGKIINIMTKSNPGTMITRGLIFV